MHLILTIFLNLQYTTHSWLICYIPFFELYHSIQSKMEHAFLNVLNDKIKKMAYGKANLAMNRDRQTGQISTLQDI